MFRHHKFTPVSVPVAPIDVEVSTSQFDDDGVEHISYAKVSAQSIIDKLPLPSEFTLLSQMQSGNLNPVNLSDYEVDHLDNGSAAEIVNSLNVENNENS